MDEPDDDLPILERLLAPWKWSAEPRSGLYGFVAMLVVFSWMLPLILAINGP